MNETDATRILEALACDERAGLPSGSNWKRYELCPPSFRLEQEARRLGQAAYSQPSRASESGDRKHAVLADQPAKLTDTETTSVELLRLRADDQVKRIFGDEPVTVLKEQRLWLELNGHRVASGRFDQVVHSDHRALIIDFKSGFAEPDPAEINSQLKFLSVVVAIHLPEITEVIAQIISGPFGVSETHFGIRELAANYSNIVATLEAINDPEAAFHPSLEACRWCPAINICQAVKDLIGPLARMSASELPAGRRASQLLDECELIDRHIQEIRAYYKRALEADPRAVPGWGLEVGAPRRHVENWPTARAKLQEFISSEALDTLATFSIPAVEKLLGEAIGVRGPRLKAQFADILGGLLEQKYPAATLKRVSAKPKLKTLESPALERPQLEDREL